MPTEREQPQGRRATGQRDSKGDQQQGGMSRRTFLVETAKAATRVAVQRGRSRRSQ